MSKALARELFGEVLGTFILVLIGCGAILAAVISGWLSALYQVAAVWTVGATLAIMASKRYGPSHLNPAVTLALCIAKRHSWSRLLPYSLAQLLGAALAGACLQLLISWRFVPGQVNFDQAGLLNTSAQAFGEFFPNPSYAELIEVHWTLAMFLEAAGAFILLWMIFLITKDIHRMTWRPALLIGITVGLLICCIAPYTQCGMNPARDLGPRIIAYLGLHGDLALPPQAHTAISVYVVGPFAGAGLSGWIWSKRG